MIGGGLALHPIRPRSRRAPRRRTRCREAHLPLRAPRPVVHPRAAAPAGRSSSASRRARQLHLLAGEPHRVKGRRSERGVDCRGRARPGRPPERRVHELVPQNARCGTQAGPAAGLPAWRSATSGYRAGPVSPPGPWVTSQPTSASANDGQNLVEAVPIDPANPPPVTRCSTGGRWGWRRSRPRLCRPGTTGCTMRTPKPASRLSLTFGLRGEFVRTRDLVFDTDIEHGWNLGPRLGAAWPLTPDARNVLRASYGVLHDMPQAVLIASIGATRVARTDYYDNDSRRGVRERGGRAAEHARATRAGRLTRTSTVPSSARR